MQTTRRPAPSVAALKALRQLAYVASGTACGAAALVYEERRRRIHFLKQVVENGRAIRNVSRSSRRNHATVVVEAGNDHAIDLDYSTPDESHQTWQSSFTHDRHIRQGANRKSIADNEFYNATRLRDEHLPSQVDRGYRRWLAKQLPDGADGDQENIISRDGERGLEAPDNTRDSRDESNDSWVARSHVRQPERLWRRNLFTNRPILRSRKSQRQGLLASVGSTESGGVQHAIKQWSTALSNNHGDGKDLTDSWQILLEATRNPQDAVVVHFSESPESLSSLARVAIRMRLSDLLESVLQYASQVGQMPILIDDVSDALSRCPDSNLFTDSATILLEWIKDVTKTSKLTHHELTHLKWLQIRLLVIFSDLEKASDERRLLSDLQTLSRLRGTEEGHLPIRALLSLRSSGVQCDRIIQQLWHIADSESELLDIFEAWQLALLPGRTILERLFDAIMRHLSASTIEAEMYGPRGRIWTSVLARKWEKCSDVSAVSDGFWAVQKAVGERLLNPVLYNTATRKCEDLGEPGQAEFIGRLRKKLLSRSKISVKIAAILRSARASEWESVHEKLSQLRVEDFGTMQIQQRAQIFDPLFQAYAQDDRDPQQIFDMANIVFDRVQETPTPAQAMRLLALALVRNGQVEALNRVHAHATTWLKKPLRLTSVDAADLLRSHYYSHRPSHISLAALMYKTFQRSWQSISKLQLPLLLVSASYEAKKRQQTRSVDSARELIRGALLRIDDPRLKDAVFLEARRMGSSDGYYELDLGQNSGVGMTSIAQGDDLHSNESSEKALRNVRPAVKPDHDQDFELRRSGYSSPWHQYHSRVKSTAAQLARKRQRGSAELAISARGMSTDTHIDDGSDSAAAGVASGTTLPVVQARFGATSGIRETPPLDSHFKHLVVKALLHDAQGPGSEADVTTLMGDWMPRNALSPSAVLASLAARSPGQQSDFIDNLLQSSGSDASMAEGRRLISQLGSTCVDSKRLASVQTMEFLKKSVLQEYERLEKHGHLPTHTLVTTLAKMMLDANQPAAAVELIRHALNSTWGSMVKPGIAVMSMLLKAYITLGRIEGVRWVVGHVLSRSERIEKGFIVTLRWGRSLWSQTNRKGLDAKSRAELLNELKRLQSVCGEQQRVQVARAREAGEQLAAYIGKHSVPAKYVAWTADDDFEGIAEDPNRSNDSTTERFKEAVFVQSVCADLLTMSKRGHGDNRTKAVNGLTKELRLVRALRKIERAQTGRTQAVEVRAS
ncbi:hypothetical protein ANO11243_069230 [Dothideomycetidae sp. 11243]|nr:hypothetical protein ANO11243_069230 [fungal sp. No.11243]